MKKMGRVLLCMLVVLCVASTVTMVALASAPGDVVGYTMQTEKAVDAYSEKSTSSSVVHHYNAGDYLFVLGQEGEWIEVFWQGKIAYVHAGESASNDNTGSGNASTSGAEDSSPQASEESDTGGMTINESNLPEKIDSGFLAEVEVEGLEEELVAQNEEAVAQAEMMESQIKRERRAKLWRIGIVAIIALIVMVGMIPMLLKKNRGQD